MKKNLYLIEKFIKIQRIHCINAKKRDFSAIYRVYDFDLTKYPRDHKIINANSFLSIHKASHGRERVRERGRTYSFNVRVVGLVEVGHIGVDLDEAVEQLVTAAI